MELTPEKPDVFSWILEDYQRNPKTKKAKLDLDGEAYLIAVAGRYVIPYRLSGTFTLQILTSWTSTVILRLRL